MGQGGPTNQPAERATWFTVPPRSSHNMPSDLETGELRRQKFPNRGLIEGAPRSPLTDLSAGWESKFTLGNGLHKTKSGLSLYWESIVPAEEKNIERLVTDVVLRTAWCS